MIDRLDIHAYADRELSAEEMARVEKEIASSPGAANELHAIQGLKSCLQTKVETPSCPDAWHACVGRLDELDRVRKAEHFVSKYAWAMSLVLFAIIIGGGMLNRYRGDSVGIGRLASDISGMTPMSAPAISQPQDLRSLIYDQTGQRPGVLLDPARIVSYAYADRPEGRIVKFVMRDAMGFVVVLIIPNVSNVDGVQPIADGMFAGQMNGLNCVIRPDGGCAVMLIGDRNTDQLHDFALSLYR